MSHRRPLPAIFATALLVILPMTSALAEEGPGHQAFEALKGLAGTWHGTASADQSNATHVFEVSAAGTVVMETMFPDTDHEMINMYHLDGDDLVLTHYCAGGNQPTMKMTKSEGQTLHFDFTGGSNLNPETDPHIHAAKLTLGEGKLESHWIAWSEGKEAGVNEISLERASD